MRLLPVVVVVCLCAAVVHGQVFSWSVGDGSESGPSGSASGSGSGGGGSGSGSGGFPTFANWNATVQKFVNISGYLAGVPLHTVNYVDLAASPEFAAALAELPSYDTTNLNKNETYALWINVYNMLAVNTVATHQCESDLFGECAALPSILNVGSLISSVWNKVAGNVGGVDYTLDDVEDYLRSPAPFKEDPRLHACIVCASISCPNIRNEAFVPDRVSDQMTAQMMNFLNNTKKGLSLDADSKTITLSPIFNWFSADFIAKSGSVIAFIEPYAPPDVQAFIKATHQADIKLTYFSYDWDVNGQVECSHDRVCIAGYSVGAFFGVLGCCVCVCGCLYCRRRRRGAGVGGRSKGDYNSLNGEARPRDGHRK